MFLWYQLDLKSDIAHTCYNFYGKPKKNFELVPKNLCRFVYVFFENLLSLISLCEN